MRSTAGGQRHATSGSIVPDWTRRSAAVTERPPRPGAGGRSFLTLFGLSTPARPRTMGDPANGPWEKDQLMRTPKFLPGILLSVLGAAVMLPLADAADLGAMVGVVRDRAGVPVAQATVTAVRVDGSGIRATVSGSDGVYSFADVPAGTWSVTSEIAGYPTTTVPSLAVTAGKATRYDLVMNAVGATTPAVAAAG